MLVHDSEALKKSKSANTVPKSQLLRNFVALSILATVTSYQADLLFGKISCQDLCLNFVPELSRYLTPQCSRFIVEKNLCIVL